MLTKHIGFILVVGMMVVAVTGCSKKQAADDMMEPQTLETLSTMAPSNIKPGTEVKPVVPVAGTQATTAIPMQQPVAQMQPIAGTVEKLEPLPPSGPFKPTNKEIQTALKNAGFYMGTVDGKLGPKSKKAVEEFQKSKDLKADGKVGPKTWAELSTYLNAAPAVETPDKQ